jgi:hypothetical protein
MRGLSFWFGTSRVDGKAVRVALAAGAVAALAVAGACNNDKTITAPPSAPRAATTSSGGYGNHGTVKLCVDASSPAGDYTFVNSSENDPSGALPGYGYHDVPSPPGTGLWWDQGDGGTGTTVFNATSGTPYLVAAGACITVLDRTAPDPDYVNNIELHDSWAAVTMTNTATPGAATYNHTDCLLDVGVVNAQPNPCETTANPTRAFANFEHGSVITFFFNASLPPRPCVLGYPYVSSNPLTNVAFNEDEVLSAYGRSSDEIRVWYTDEHALTLGVRQLFVNNKAPLADVTVNYPIATMAGNMTSTLTASATGSPLAVGSTIYTGLRSAVDGAGRPLHPSLFITDITADPTSTAGDWQMGGSPFIPNAVYGTWKGAVVSIDSTRTPPRKTMTPDADTPKNHKVVGPGGVNPPAAAQDLGFSSEIVWSINALGLDLTTHTYRLQFMVHDGDQNKTGGDVGEACFNVGPGTPTNFTQVTH